MNYVDYNTADIFRILEKVKINPSESIESETIEFKEYSKESSLHGDKCLAEEICALANLRGGIIIIGIRDSSKLDGTNWFEQLVGFQVVDVVTTESRIKGRLDNATELRVENITYEAKNYTAIFVKKNRDSLVTTTSGKACIRDGRSSRPMNAEEIESAIKSLHTYDWSSDLIHNATLADLDNTDVQNALNEHCFNRGLESRPDIPHFLESIGITKNGILTKAGLIFLGTATSINKYLGDFEFRFSWKEGLDLKINEVWSGNLWTSIKKAEALFNRCVVNRTFDYKGNLFEVPNLDPQAFHEAFVNAVVHRDYSMDGMIVVEFVGKRLTITSPGLFYGGVTSNNIAYHEPRHRNKTLARILMQYKLVDRAGMGVLRMGVQSLVYGRGFPAFEELTNSIRVSMEAEYIRPGIFVLTRGKTELFIPDLIILNSLHRNGSMSMWEAMDRIHKTTNNPWAAIIDMIARWDRYVELCGSKHDIYLRVKKSVNDLFDIQKNFRTVKNSPKFVRLFFFMKKHGSATNEDVSSLVGYSHSSTTSRFLGEIKWIERVGKGVASRWRLAQPYS